MNWENLRTTPNRWMAAWLRRRGWVCFYLDEQARSCRGEWCWLALYQAEEERKIYRPGKSWPPMPRPIPPPPSIPPPPRRS